MALILAPLLAACGGGSGQPPPPPPNASLVISGEARVNEADNPLVVVSLSLDRPARSIISAPVIIAGTATRGYDYVASGEMLTVPLGGTAASIEIDIYRDFESEGDETITVELGMLTGEAELTGNTLVTIDIIDGEGPIDLKNPSEPTEPVSDEEDLSLFPAYFVVNDSSVDFGLIVWNYAGRTVTLTVEYASDIHFSRDLHLLSRVHIEPISDPLDPWAFPIPHEYSVPLDSLNANTHYYVRGYLDDPPESFVAAFESFTSGYFGFATNAQGDVRTRCETPARTPDPSGEDPLFEEQWHLVNTGQMAFSDSGGVEGADLDMRQAIEDKREGSGIALAVVDTGLETCHPDLAANVPPGRSYNFSAEFTPGGHPEEPFNHETLGDHGTSVAGVAAAVAHNGLGGRGVAPSVDLIGFNLGASLGFDSERDLFRALGGSDASPDSASVDIFNMSWGTEIPSGRASEDFVNLLKHGTKELRDGRGALYVKAAGNAFEACFLDHPLNVELGCIGANADPDQNLPYVLAIGGFNASDVKSSYSSAGANLWVVGPSGEDGELAPGMITTDQAGAESGYNLIPQNRLEAGHALNADGDYVSNFGGTSSAAPAVAGVIALLLEANPEFSWRDVKHLLAASARKIDPDRAESRVAFKGHPYVAQHAWLINGAGYKFHNWYGFGAASVDDAITLADSHTPGSLGEFIESEWFSATSEMTDAHTIPDADGRGITTSVNISSLPATASIEAVVLQIAAEHFYPNELGFTLTSPSGTASVLNAPFNAILDAYWGVQEWPLLSNAFYGESPNGEWTLNVVDLAEGDEGSLEGWSLKLYYGEHTEGAASPLSGE